MDGEATPKRRYRFSWAAVESPVLRALLASVDSPNPVVVRGAPRVELVAAAARWYGDPIQAKQVTHFDAWQVLRRSWIPRARRDDLIGLASYVVRPAIGDGVGTWTRSRVQEVLLRQRMTENYKVNLLKAFRHAHRTKQDVRSASVDASPAGLSMAVLVGRGEASSPLFGHQVETVAALDRLAQQPTARRGLVVLPTGAGKTMTAVRWVLQEMASDPSLRVLWLAHQQELLDQAADVFTTQASSCPAGWAARMRLVFAGRSSAATLVDPDLKVALVTWQSLRPSWDERNRRRVAAFLGNRSIVVVDEAHHVGAETYHEMLSAILSSGDVTLVGLTATPWPTQMLSAMRLHDAFPATVAQVTPEELQASGVLARPVIHTVSTGTRLLLDDEELSAADTYDLPSTVLERLANEARDEVTVRSWVANAELWGKSLVFATTKAHADALGRRFAGHDVPTRVLHSGTGGRREVLRWFHDQQQPAVLVSVGMLTEGVDLPQARTAVLARPTTSRILMRQMIGRVLRGTKSGGEDVAHILYLRDQWLNFDEVLEPAELPDLDASLAPEDSHDAGRWLPPVRSDAGTPLREDVLSQIRRIYSRKVDDLPIDQSTTSAALAGYYSTDGGVIPVMEHQIDGFAVLIDKALSGASFQGTPARAIFDDDHPPYPTDRAVRAIVRHCRTYSTRPPFTEIRATFSPYVVACDLRERMAQTDEEREKWLLERFETSLARVAYRSFDHFEEAVDRELRELRRVERGQAKRPDPERTELGLLTPKTRLRAVERELPRVRDIVLRMREVLAGETALERMRLDDLPARMWTDRPIQTAWAYWSVRTAGKGAGTRIIRVNRALRAPKTQVSESLLGYLLFHELLHDLLPGQGHDAEFRRLEALWPEADQLDAELDTLTERVSVDQTGRSE